MTSQVRGTPRPPVRSLADLRIGIVSDAHHYRFPDGRVGSLTPLMGQFDQWASLCRELVVCAPLLDGPPPGTHSPYRATNIRFMAVEAAGGRTLRSKLHLLRTTPRWVRAITRMMADVDAFHLRCPNNIGIVALLLTWRSPHLRQAVYTGNWLGYPGEPWTYRWQRWFLRERFRGPVAAYGNWPNQPSHVVPTFSPAFSQTQWAVETEQVERRLRGLDAASRMAAPLRLVSIGGAVEGKRHDVVIRALALLRQRGIDAALTICGGGPALESLQAAARALGVDTCVTFTGAIPQSAVLAHLREADFMTLASRAEGFSKAVSEAMCCGAVPILSDIGMHRQITGEGDRGRVFPLDDPGSLATILEELSAKPEVVRDMVVAGRAYAAALTHEAWRRHLQAMLETHWNLLPAAAAPTNES